MISIGLDLSITATGVCIYDSETKHTIYYIIGHKLTQKTLNYKSDWLQPVLYVKNPTNGSMEYHEKEQVKTNNIYRIVQCIREIIKKHNPEVATIEGVSNSSRGAVLDLEGLNYMTRMTLIECGINHIFIVAPTQNKKFATGNGQAEKDVMISAWKNSDTKVRTLPDFIKSDDIADAYFLARFGCHLSSIKAR